MTTLVVSTLMFLGGFVVALVFMELVFYPWLTRRQAKWFEEPEFAEFVRKHGSTGALKNEDLLERGDDWGK